MDLVSATWWGRSCIGICRASNARRWAGAATARARWRCETCGGKRDAPVHWHEVWSYDDERGVQKLEALKCLCERCHEATHPGHANVKGRGAEALEWLMQVNGDQSRPTGTYQAEAFAQWGTAAGTSGSATSRSCATTASPCRRCSTTAADCGA